MSSYREYKLPFDLLLLLTKIGLFLGGVLVLGGLFDNGQELGLYLLCYCAIGYGVRKNDLENKEAKRRKQEEEDAFWKDFEAQKLSTPPAPLPTIEKAPTLDEWLQEVQNDDTLSAEEKAELEKQIKEVQAIIRPK